MYKINNFLFQSTGYCLIYCNHNTSCTKPLKTNRQLHHLTVCAEMHEHYVQCEFSNFWKGDRYLSNGDSQRRSIRTIFIENRIGYNFCLAQCYGITCAKQIYLTTSISSSMQFWKVFKHFLTCVYLFFYYPLCFFTSYITYQPIPFSVRHHSRSNKKKFSIRNFFQRYFVALFPGPAVTGPYPGGSGGNSTILAVNPPLCRFQIALPSEKQSFRSRDRGARDRRAEF